MRMGRLAIPLYRAARSGLSSRRRILIAELKSWWKGHRLPPGNFFRLEPLLAADPKALALKSVNTGPILTSVWGDKVAICVTSLPVARRLLKRHRDDLKALSIDITSVVPKGILRTMEGIDHTTYRKHFSRAISPTDFSNQMADVRSIIAEGLDKAGSDQRPDTTICNEVALHLLLRTFLGLQHHSLISRELKDQFATMAPNGFAWKVGPRQKAAFETMRRRLVALAPHPKERKEVLPDSVLGRLFEENAIDLTTIGNLIYMVEMGRADFGSFFCRIVNFLDDDWPTFSRVAQSERSELGVLIAQSVVLETLRMEQSERLMRAARRDFVFDDLLFPKGAIVRICLWEAHKDARAFEDPFSFRSDRFLKETYTADQFSPFGLGHHKCPAADATVQLGSLFVEVYARWRLARRGIH
jgi:cytochrome P450